MTSLRLVLRSVATAWQGAWEWWHTRAVRQVWQLGVDDAAVSALVRRWSWAATHMPNKADRIRESMMGVNRG